MIRLICWLNWLRVMTFLTFYSMVLQVVEKDPLLSVYSKSCIRHQQYTRSRVSWRNLRREHPDQPQSSALSFHLIIILKSLHVRQIIMTKSLSKNSSKRLREVNSSIKSSRKLLKSLWSTKLIIWPSKPKQLWEEQWRPTCHSAESLPTVRVYQKLFNQWDLDVFKWECQHQMSPKSFMFSERFQVLSTLICLQNLHKTFQDSRVETFVVLSWCFRQWNSKTQTSVRSHMCLVPSMRATPEKSQKMWSLSKVQNNWEPFVLSSMTCLPKE